MITNLYFKSKKSFVPFVPTDIAGCQLWLKADAGIRGEDLTPGLVAKVLLLKKAPVKLADVNFGAKPDLVAIAGNVNAGPEDFGELKENFAVH